MGKHPWAYSFLRYAPLVGVLTLVSTSTMRAADPPVNSGAPTYVPPSAVGSGAVNNRLSTTTASGGPTNVGAIPTPDTLGAPPGIPAPSQTTATSLGQYRNAKGEVKLEKVLLDRYQASVVSVSARDLSGNVLGTAMGVGVGRNAQFIAVPLSLLLGNEQQWADQIEISHAAGNRYYAKVALIDEEKNIVLLAPEASPAPLPFVREENERPQITVFTISLGGGGRAPRIHRGMLAAANTETGLLSVSGEGIDNSQAGTAVIASTGELVGMLLPDGRGVLSSTIQKLIAKAQKATPIDPSRIGVILGRGVMVGTGTGNYPTISAALEAIKKGEAPRTDPTMYTPAKTRVVAPKEADKVVIKVLPGTYKEGKTISLPSNLSLAGSGPDRTTLLGTDPTKPVLLLQGVENSMVSNLRITPAAKQSMKAPAVIVSKVRGATFLGNVIEARGGVGLWASQSTNVRLNGNAFPESTARAVSCDRSSMRLEANAFVGSWPIAFSADRGCTAELHRTLFFANQAGVNVTGDSGKVRVIRSSFIRTASGIKVAGKTGSLEMADNLFFECESGLTSTASLPASVLGRNAVWKTRLTSQGRNPPGLDLVRTEPKFVAPENYDFRLVPGQNQLSTALTEPGAELGAYTANQWVGPYYPQMARALGVAVGEPGLRETWINTAAQGIVNQLIDL